MKAIIAAERGNLVRVADEVWLATALLHREHPEREDFSVQEIVNRAARENLTSTLRPGVSVHAYLHCVANRKPNSATYRMLYETGRQTRRLYRPTDPAHPGRNGKIKPRREQIPERYHSLLDWYEKEYCQTGMGMKPAADPVLALRGVGNEIWRDVDPDEFVRKLREGWQ